MPLKLEKVLGFVLKSRYSDFYRKKYENADIKNFSRLPILSLSELAGVDLKSRTFLPMRLVSKNIIWGRFGGEPAPFYVSKKAESLKLKNYARVLGEFLIGVDDVVFVSGPGSVLQTYNALNNILGKRVLPVWEILLKCPALISEFVRNCEIKALIAAPQMLFKFGDLLNREDLSKNILRILLISPQSRGYLSKEKKKRISGLFPKAKFSRLYGIRELDKIGFQCKFLFGSLKNKFHFFSDVYAEVSDQGELLITTLDKIPTPLIRYHTGDLARAAGQCECGKIIFEIIKHEP